MKLAIELAKSVKGQTTPNPPVGAVVVKDHSIVGFGAHLKSGEAHAEVIAIEMAKERAIGATLYVTLEPCSHYGKTAPCVEFIIEKQLKKVVIACLDEHDKVAGKGMKKLERAGVEVEVGLLRNEALPLYDMFFHYVGTKLPYVTVKTAISMDGKIATKTGESKWITNKTARLDVHHYRHHHDAILVGIHTILQDNPRLTTRIKGGKHPIRLILDTHLRMPMDANVVTDCLVETWIFVGNHVRREKIEKFSDRDFVRIIPMKDEVVHIKEVLEYVATNHITSVFVEGGATVNDAFLQQKLINQLILYIAPLVIGGKDAKTAFAGIGFEKLADSLQLEVKQVDLLDDNVKIVAVRKE